MRFISSAIKFTPIDGCPMIVYGKRHCNCLEQMYKMKINRDKSKDIQGFIILIDGMETFVDRYDGAQMHGLRTQHLSRGVPRIPRPQVAPLNYAGLQVLVPLPAREGSA